MCYSHGLFMFCRSVQHGHLHGIRSFQIVLLHRLLALLLCRLRLLGVFSPTSCIHPTCLLVKHGHMSNLGVVLSRHAHIFNDFCSWHSCFLRIGVAGFPWCAFWLWWSLVGILSCLWLSRLFRVLWFLWDRHAMAVCSSVQNYRRQLTISFNNNLIMI